VVGAIVASRDGGHESSLLATDLTSASEKHPVVGHGERNLNEVCTSPTRNRHYNIDRIKSCARHDLIGYRLFQIAAGGYQVKSICWPYDRTTITIFPFNILSLRSTHLDCGGMVISPHIVCLDRRTDSCLGSTLSSGSPMYSKCISR
jgi:hypothetical protein